jgi:hypothetical protein
MIWKVEAEGDTVYVRGETLDEAERKFNDAFGFIPEQLVTWMIVSDIPDGEEFIGESK